jgi:hypothetical protein
MADGKGCTCHAYCSSECACGADWTPQYFYDMRAENEKLKEAIRRIADQDATLSVCNGNVTVTMDGTLTDEEREAVERAVGFCECTTSPLPTSQQIVTLQRLLERTK